MQRIQRTIADCIAPAKFTAVARTDLVSTAVAGMLETQTSCALIVENERLVGVFTSRDFLSRVCAEKLDPKETKIGDVMTPNPTALQPHHCITYAINRMAEMGYRHVPIVDENFRPVSLLDTRLVMSHLIKVFAEFEQAGDEEGAEDWIDIGGG
jgi:CBS domain-containing protein